MGYVSRGGEKLAFALERFDVDPSSWICADFGSSTGGFADCLLQRGAKRVYSVDTCYGTLAWSLRTDPRVVVMERQNALYLQLPEPMDLVTIDVGWTRQKFILPKAAQGVRRGGFVLSLLKTQYEAEPAQIKRGRLDPARVSDVVEHVLEELRTMGVPIVDVAESPLVGRKGNVEYWLKVIPGHCQK